MAKKAKAKKSVKKSKSNSKSKNKGSVLKSIWAFIAGFFTVALLSVATDTVLEALKVFPPISQPQALLPWMLALALVYRTIFTVLGGYVTAALAPRNPMNHVRFLGVFGLVMAIFGCVAFWSFGSHWYPVALAVLAYPSVWYGGKLKTKK